MTNKLPWRIAGAILAAALLGRPALAAAPEAATAQADVARVTDGAAGAKAYAHDWPSGPLTLLVGYRADERGNAIFTRKQLQAIKPGRPLLIQLSFYADAVDARHF